MCLSHLGPNPFDMAIPYTIIIKSMKWSKDAGQKHYIYKCFINMTESSTANEVVNVRCLIIECYIMSFITSFMGLQQRVIGRRGGVVAIGHAQVDLLHLRCKDIYDCVPLYSCVTSMVMLKNLRKMLEYHETEMPI